MKFEGFTGPSASSRSSNQNAERTMNLYTETGTGTPKSARVLYGTPGLSLMKTLPGGAIRGVWANTSRLFAIAGASFYEVFQTTAGSCTPTNGSAIVTSSGFFDTAMPAGTTMTINGTPVVIASVQAGGQLTLQSVWGGGGGSQACVINWASYNLRGNVANDGLPAYIYPNGQQLLIVSGGVAYCDGGSGPVACAFTLGLSGTVTLATVGGNTSCTWYSGDLFSQNLVGTLVTVNGTPTTCLSVGQSGLFMVVSGVILSVDPVAWSGTPTLPAATGAFIDGYFIVAGPNQKRVQISAINDGTTWAAIDFGVKEGYPDNIAAIFADHEELWLFGTDTTEVWQDTGAASFPFARIPGAFIHHGLAAAASPSRLKEGVAWLTSDPTRGGIRAVWAQGFQPQQISTPEVEQVWDTYTTWSDAVTFSYVENGHEFWIITFPTANATWCFDATENTWTQRGWWNGASNDRQRQMFHAYTFGAHIVGDWQNGNVYKQSIAYLDDAGTAIHWERTAPHVAGDMNKRFFGQKFQLDMEVGQSTGTPTVNLSWSDNGGHTFSTPIAGTPSDATFAGRMLWRRLGCWRDRIFRATGQTGATRVALIQAFIDLIQGN